LSRIAARLVAFTGDENAIALPPYANKGSDVMHRHRIKQTHSLDEHLDDQAQQLRTRAQGMSPGIEREWLMRRARQAEITKQMQGWIVSPALQPPK
jgi:hypothetical protein